MKISVFMPITNPKRRGDTFLEAIKTHLYWADELVVVDGGSTDGSLQDIQEINDKRIKIVNLPWPQEKWSWTEFCKHWNYGLDACTGDWVAAGETDHIFHENEAKRVRQEVERETNLGKIVMTVNKMQCGFYANWYSKSQMFYFVYKAKYPQIRYGFDPHHPTDLCHPIWWEGSYIEKDVPAGQAIVHSNPKFEKLIGGTGAVLWNYLWTFKTLEQVVNERKASSYAWNQFRGFTEIYGKKFPDKDDDIINWIVSQLKSVHEKATKVISLEKHPDVMRRKILGSLKPEHVGSLEFYKLLKGNNI